MLDVGCFALRSPEQICGPFSVEKTVPLCHSGMPFGVAFIYGQCLKGNSIVTQLYLVYERSWAVSVLRRLSSLQQELETFSLLSNGTSINLSNQVAFASSDCYCSWIVLLECFAVLFTCKFITVFHDLDVLISVFSF